MQIKVKGFKEAVAKLQGIAAAPQSQKFQRTLLEAVNVIRNDAISRVGNLTGRTRSAIITAPGKGAMPSAYVKIDKRLASVAFHGKPFPYPFAVEFGHGGPHPAPPDPFFWPAVNANKSEVRRIVKDGIQEVINPYIQTTGIGGEFL